ncbi:MAG: hypothetical protein ABSA79_12140 [Candidatus Bathyarchaeia archaeon]|jgi:hypothetical protein
MTASKTVFENEEAVRLLNYFIFYKELCNKNENHPVNQEDDGVRIGILPKPEVLTVK